MEVDDEEKGAGATTTTTTTTSTRKRHYSATPVRLRDRAKYGIEDDDDNDGPTTADLVLFVQDEADLAAKKRAILLEEQEHREARGGMEDPAKFSWYHIKVRGGKMAVDRDLWLPKSDFDFADADAAAAVDVQEEEKQQEEASLSLHDKGRSEHSSVSGVVGDGSNDDDNDSFRYNLSFDAQDETPEAAAVAMDDDAGNKMEGNDDDDVDMRDAKADADADSVSSSENVAAMYQEMVKYEEKLRSKKDSGSGWNEEEEDEIQDIIKKADVLRKVLINTSEYASILTDGQKQLLDDLKHHISYFRNLEEQQRQAQAQKDRKLSRERATALTDEMLALELFPLMKDDFFLQDDIFSEGKKGLWFSGDTAKNLKQRITLIKKVEAMCYEGKGLLENLKGNDDDDDGVRENLEECIRKMEQVQIDAANFLIAKLKKRDLIIRKERAVDERKIIMY